MYEDAIKMLEDDLKSDNPTDQVAATIELLKDHDRRMEEIMKMWRELDKNEAQEVIERLRGMIRRGGE